MAKTTRRLLAIAAATAMVLGFSAPALAGNPAQVKAPVAGSYAKLTGVEVGVYDGTGVLVATCYTSAATVKNGSANFSCSFSGDLSGAELVIIDANEGQEAYGVSAQTGGQLTLKNIQIGKTGWFSVDLGGGIPEI